MNVTRREALKLGAVMVPALNLGLLRARQVQYPPRFGMNYDVDGGLPGVAAKLGCKPLTMAKIFNTEIPASFPGHPVPPTVTRPFAVIKVALTGAAPYISASDLTKLAAVFGSMPTTGRPIVSINQEGEAKRFGYTGPQVAGSHFAAYQLFKAHAPANARYCQDFETFSASPWGRGTAFPAYVCCKANGQVDLPLYLMDWYPSGSAIGPADSVAPLYQAIKTLVPKARVGVAECNYTTDLTGGITWIGGQARWFAEAWSWALGQRVNCFVPYFLTEHGVPWPPPADVITQLSQIAHASGL